MKFTEKPKKKVLLLAGLGFFALLALIGGSYAAYSRQAYQRGVARNRDGETVCFTSNYLQSCESKSTNYAGRTILFSQKEKDDGGTLSIPLYIYNYANKNAQMVSQKDITYNLTITFDGGTGTGYNVESKSDETVERSGTTYTVKNRTLIGRSARSHEYTITIPAADIDKVKITVTAVPDNLSVTNYQILAAVLAPCTGAATNTFTYKGDFIDKSASPTEYSGFNYEISISSGAATGTLTWDSKAVEIDTYFLKNLRKTEQEISEILKKGSLTISMDQSNGSGDYLIPFYIKDKSEIPDSWETMETKIHFEAKQSETQTS